MAQKSNSIIPQLSEHLFWDVDKSTLDVEKNKTYLIERVITRGDLDDLKILMQMYDTATIRQEITKAGSLDKKTLNWAALYFNIKITDFRCYSKIQSNQIHWNF